MQLLNEKQAAEILDCSIYKMQKDRRIGSPIPFIKIGKSVRYDKNDVIAYLTNQRFVSTSQYIGGQNV